MHHSCELPASCTLNSILAHALPRLNAAGSLGATANAAAAALMYADMVAPASPALGREYQCWGLSQVRYMLGDAGRSLVVGVGKNPPKRTQDRGAACPDPPEVRGWEPWGVGLMGEGENAQGPLRAVGQAAQLTSAPAFSSSPANVQTSACLLACPPSSAGVQPGDWPAVP